MPTNAKRGEMVSAAVTFFDVAAARGWTPRPASFLTGTGLWGARAMDADTIAEIYEAGAFPDRWLGLLEKIGRDVGALGGNFIRNSDAEIAILSSPSVEAVTREFERQGWNRDNSRVQRLVARADHPGFLTDSDLHTAEELRRLPIYADFLTPRGVDAGAATVVQGAQDDVLAIAFEGFADHAAAASAVPVLDAYRPHFARAAALGGQIAAARATELANAFGTLGASIALLDAKGRVVAATALFAQAFDDLVQDGGERLRIVDPRGDERLGAALEALRATGHGASIPVRSGAGQGRAILHLIPATRQARDLFSRVWSFALLAKPGNRLLPGGDIIGALFDLTPAEARVARSVARGQRPKEIARDSHVSVETVRSQLKRIFHKTETDHQAELAILINSLV